MHCSINTILLLFFCILFFFILLDFYYFFFFFFFLMIRRPPRSTLFPTRRSSDLRRTNIRRQCRSRFPSHGCDSNERSEEHTSELQSHSDLVCRLLLEKKKKKKKKIRRNI